MRGKLGQSQRGLKRRRIAARNNSPSFEEPSRKRPSREISQSAREVIHIEDPFNACNAFDLSQFDDDTQTRDYFDALSDDIVISILAKASASASCPADLGNLSLVNKRFRVLGLDQEVLSKAPGKSFWVGAKKWSDSAHQFLIRCADAGNVEACHFLGMINFYCLANHANGINLLKKAAQRSHAGALYALAIIYFNGSGSQAGGLCCQCDPDSATTLCIKAANLGNLDALREVAYCLQQGLGLPCSPVVAHRLLIKANTLELIKIKSTNNIHSQNLNQPLLTNYGFYEKMGKEVHAANKFMIEWWWLARGEERGREDEGLHMCSNILCGRRETRPNGFRRCSVCGTTIYCSHACQEMHWKMEHCSTCVGQNIPMELV